MVTPSKFPFDVISISSGQQDSNSLEVDLVKIQIRMITRISRLTRVASFDTKFVVRAVAIKKQSNGCISNLVDTAKHFFF